MTFGLFKACICEEEGTSIRDAFVGEGTAGLCPSKHRREELIDGLDTDEFRVPIVVLNRPVKPHGFPTYSSSPDQPLLGLPLREGNLWHLSMQEQFTVVNCSLYVNGLSFNTGNTEAAISLSPFSFVRNCRFQSAAYSQMKSFKLSLLDHDPCCYFAVQGLQLERAEEERSDWVLALSYTILLITESLLPRCAVTCQPRRDNPETWRRLLASYLVHRENSGLVSVVFCELQAHEGDFARFIMYEDEECLEPVGYIPIFETTLCLDIVGINCCCFILETHHFAAQTPSERKIWLRALSNVKVKLQNRAPPPTDQELRAYREGIQEHMDEFKTLLQPASSKDALLTPMGLQFQVTDLQKLPLPPKYQHVSTPAASTGEPKAPKLLQVSL
mmetsp:Transcript_48427/g.89206  ORF Transcript_48427/g.89206 Transcript_48427/m.89206 type:complete len:387 (+) Transcript_48427:129-1289(+)